MPAEGGCRISLYTVSLMFAKMRDFKRKNYCWSTSNAQPLPGVPIVISPTGNYL